MNRTFYTVLVAQFFSALADNALLFAAIGLLMFYGSPDWHHPLLASVFVVAYIVLAPFVGPFADALPKGRVLFIGNAIKFVGCATMLLGLPPLLAYSIVGIGAATYSPAKYGILTEILPPEKLVAANGWMEGFTVAAIVLGAIIGGVLINPDVATSGLGSLKLSADIAPPMFAIGIITALYLLAAIVNLFIPRLPIDHRLPSKKPGFILHDFWHSFLLLWKDPLGQVSLAVTTLFWGVGATLRLMVIAWAAYNLAFGLDLATQITGLVAFGIAIGSALAGWLVPLKKSVSVLPAGIALGFLPIILTGVHDFWLAALVLTLLGVLAGYFVVPLNALLQHRGHLLMGAGHSIAQQNFNENISILLMTGAYALMMRAEWHIHTIMILFGLFISTLMTLIWKRHRHDVVH
ncbi:lysophospholipid transporter LplT [Betaproteobacteria bacterium SCN2]|nr:lysophospholipid transporter LplT [Betaproteobacteria bacterium SCN2]